MDIPRTREKLYPRLLDWLRYFCAFMLYMYGTSKLLHFQFHLNAELAQRPIGSLNGYELTWFYFGYSRSYSVILGLTQIVGATLLLFRKTTLLAAAAMLPVMANIVLINAFILVDDWGPYFMSVVICSSLLVILWYQRAWIFGVFWGGQDGEPAASRRLHVWIRVAIVGAVLAIMGTGAILQRVVRR
jgi:hypothetical protein